MLFDNILKSVLEKATLSVRRLEVLNPLTIHKQGEYSKAILALVLICLLWGTTWIASKLGVQYMPALELAGLRQFFAGLGLVIFFLSKKAVLPKGREWYSVIVLSILSFIFSNSLMVWGIKYIPAGLASIIGATFPIWVVIINLFVSKEPLPRLSIIGFLLGFVGVCIIFYEHLSDFLNPGFRFGIFLSLFAAWSWAVGTVYTKKKSFAYNPYFSVGLQMLIAGVVTLAATFLIDNPEVKAIPLHKIPWQSWVAVIYLAIFGSIISFLAYLYALQRLPTGQMSIYGYINPIVAIILGSFLLNEKISIFIIIGGAVTLIGVYIINKAFRKISTES